MADLDDFFAKKDRKKPKASKKFSTSEELAEKLKDKKPEPPKIIRKEQQSTVQSTQLETVLETEILTEPVTQKIEVSNDKLVIVCCFFFCFNCSFFCVLFDGGRVKRWNTAFRREYGIVHCVSVCVCTCTHAACIWYMCKQKKGKNVYQHVRYAYMCVNIVAMCLCVDLYILRWLADWHWNILYATMNKKNITTRYLHSICILHLYLPRFLTSNN